jgi:hypothetical protein
MTTIQILKRKEPTAAAPFLKVFQKRLREGKRPR